MVANAAIARAAATREQVLFARSNTGIRARPDLRNRSVWLPDMNQSAGLWARAR